MDDATEETFPPLYAPWLREIAGGAMPVETRATCDHCVMLPAETALPNPTFFNPHTKCCTYQPAIPNFLAGRILADPGPEAAMGRASLERRIAARVRVSPFGLSFTRTFALLYIHSRDAFGRDAALRCPHFSDSGTCGIWRHRPGVCATWFCKHERGETSQRFWGLTDKLLREIETEVAIWCAAKLNVGAAALFRSESDFTNQADAAELDGSSSSTRYSQLWGEWAGREGEFYLACSALVEPLTWDALRALCGPRVGVLAQLVRDAYDHLSSAAIPARLKWESTNAVPAGHRHYALTTYSPHDPLVISERLLDALSYFDGRPTEDALTAIRSERHVSIAPALLRRMVDFGVLKAHSL